MATNIYLEDCRLDKKGDAAIRVSIVIGGTRFLTSTGYKISPAKWDSERRQVRKGASNGKGITWATINSGLAAIVKHFTAYENECEQTNFTPDVEALKNEFSDKFGRKRSAIQQNVITFFDYYNEFVKETSVRNSWADASFEKFHALKNLLCRFRPADSITFDTFSEIGLHNFVQFLVNSEGMKNTTIRNQLNFIGMFLRWATAKGYNTCTDFQTFKPKLKMVDKKVVFLTWDEVMRVFNYTLPENGTVVTLHRADGTEYTKVVEKAGGIERAKDIFLFSCFTSLRYSDAIKIKWSDIDGDSFSVTTQKTHDALTIEINKYARAILDKYKDYAEQLGGFVFPHLANQKMNVYLKTLGELCEINTLITQTYFRGAEREEETRPKYELIGTHTGRRTFVCNALAMGVPAQVVMSWTGHSDYNSMRPYIAVADETKAKYMKVFDNR
jgi:integrase